MKKVIALLVVFSFLMFNIGYVSLSSAQEMVTEKISSLAKAKEITANAGGAYWEGAAPPPLTGEVALPVVDGETGNIIGYIVADHTKLVSALNEAGYTQVASALAAVEAGTTAGLTVGAGVSIGTIGLAAAGAAAVVGIALAVSGGGGTTSQH